MEIVKKWEKTYENIMHATMLCCEQQGFSFEASLFVETKKIIEQPGCWDDIRYACWSLVEDCASGLYWNERYDHIWDEAFEKEWKKIY